MAYTDPQQIYGQIDKIKDFGRIDSLLVLMVYYLLEYLTTKVKQLLDQS